jgi:hypothetical protein
MDAFFVQELAEAAEVLITAHDVVSRMRTISIDVLLPTDIPAIKGICVLKSFL